MSKQTMQACWHRAAVSENPDQEFKDCCHKHAICPKAETTEQKTATDETATQGTYTIDNLPTDKYDIFLSGANVVYIQQPNTGVFGYDVLEKKLHYWRCNEYGMAEKFAKHGTEIYAHLCNKERPFFRDKDSTCNDDYCEVDSLDTVIKHSSESYIKKYPKTFKPSNQQELCEYTSGTWTGKSCDCRKFFKTGNFDKKRGCTTTPEKIKLLCNYEHMICTGSEVYMSAACETDKGVQIKGRTYMCKWVGAPDGSSGKCMPAQKFCE